MASTRHYLQPDNDALTLPFPHDRVIGSHSNDGGSLSDSRMFLVPAQDWPAGSYRNVSENKMATGVTSLPVCAPKCSLAGPGHSDAAS